MRVFVGGSRDQRAAAVRAAFGAAAPPLREVHAAAHWPFLRYIVPPVQPPTIGRGATLWYRDLQLAFPVPRVPGIRLVLTQSTYQLQRVLDAFDATHTYAVVADGDARLRSEMAGLRGPWSQIEIVDLGPGPRDSAPAYESAGHFEDVPQSAAALLLHQATAQLESGNVDASIALIEKAIALDPSWEASHFELGKAFLHRDDTEAASSAFAEAGRLMPTFAAAFSNLGAALGEMDRSSEALAALEQALAHDPNGFPIMNNIGAVHREMGALDRAETAFRRVVDVAPTFVFGYYNLGHTLFLAGRFDDARDAYERGYERDGQKNARQACRLAVVRAACGETSGAMALLKTLAGDVPAEAMQELAAEAEGTLEALATLPSLSAIDLSGVVTLVRELATLRS